MFWKECRAVFKSIIYFAFLIVIAMFYISQLGDYAGADIEQYSTLEEASMEPLADNPLIAPVPGLDNYGYKHADVPEIIMPNAIAELVREMAAKEFTSYATGFYKGVILSQEQLDEIAVMLNELTGLPVQEIYNRTNDKIREGGGFPVDYSDVIPVLTDYDTFLDKMSIIDKMIGGGSLYASGSLIRFGTVPVTYEEKLSEYHAFLSEDKITGAYARLFCDYMGIVISLFSIFVPVSFLLRDRRAKMNELIYSRQTSSVKLVIVRYLALVCMTLLPFVLLSLFPTVQLALFGIQNGLTVDMLAFFKYIAAWLLPTALTTTAVAYFFATLTDTPIAILVQFIWSLIGMFSTPNLEGGQYGLSLTIRHNTLGNLQAVQENMGALVINRFAYTALSLLLVVGSIYLYRLKREGQLDVIGSVKNALGNRRNPV